MPDASSINPTPHPAPATLAGERVSFTGVLASMTHAAAAELVQQQGGEASEHVSRQTTLLVIGEEGWPLEDDGRVSKKLQEVLDWQARGAAIRVIEEREFLRILGFTDANDEVRRLHTPATLSQILGVPVHIIRSWERAGLIRAVRRLHRLPYFDFQEVASARRLSELLQAGVAREEIERSLRSIPGVATGVRRPFEQLDILVRDQRLLVRDAHGLRDLRGQRLLDWDGETQPHSPSDNSDADPHPVSISFLEARRQALELEQRDWFIEGCRHVDEGNLPEAVEAFRLALMTEAENPEVHFHLGDVLYRLGRSHAALERYFAAVELDHDYLEAWMQIGALHREHGDAEAALDAFRVALDIHDHFADVRYQMAETLAELGRWSEAVPHWEAYLQQEQRGPWADLARQRLAAAVHHADDRRGVEPHPAQWAARP